MSSHLQCLKVKYGCIYVQVDESSFLHLVHLLCRNLQYKHDYLKLEPCDDKRIVITPELLAKMFNIPNEGSKYYLNSR